MRAGTAPPGALLPSEEEAVLTPALGPKKLLGQMLDNHVSEDTSSVTWQVCPWGHKLT